MVNFELKGELSKTFAVSLRKILSGGDVYEKAPLLNKFDKLSPN
jgi:hypothetical protein